MTGIVTAAWISRISLGSLIRATPPAARMSAGTRSSAITAQAPASSAIRACSGVTTSMITPPFNISARPFLTTQVPVSTTNPSTHTVHVLPGKLPLYHCSMPPTTVQPETGRAFPALNGPPCQQPARPGGTLPPAGRAAHQPQYYLEQHQRNQYPGRPHADLLALRKARRLEAELDRMLARRNQNCADNAIRAENGDRMSIQAGSPAWIVDFTDHQHGRLSESHLNGHGVRIVARDRHPVASRRVRVQCQPCSLDDRHLAGI